MYGHARREGGLGRRAALTRPHRDLLLHNTVGAGSVLAFPLRRGPHRDQGPAGGFLLAAGQRLLQDPAQVAQRAQS